MFLRCVLDNSSFANCIIARTRYFHCKKSEINYPYPLPLTACSSSQTLGVKGRRVSAATPPSSALPCEDSWHPLSNAIVRLALAHSGIPNKRDEPTVAYKRRVHAIPHHANDLRGYLVQFPRIDGQDLVLDGTDLCGSPV